VQVAEDFFVQLDDFSEVVVDGGSKAARNGREGSEYGNVNLEKSVMLQSRGSNVKSAPTFIRNRTSLIYPSSVLISSSRMRRRCNERSAAAGSRGAARSPKPLSSESLAAVKEARLLRSVLECA
jgi:hypothetical protein